MNINEITITTANLRLYKANEDYSAAKLMIEKGFYRAANERAFFGMYHAARAALTFISVNINGSGAVMEYFADSFVRKGLFTSDIYRLFKAGLKARDFSDYCDYHTETKAEALRTVDNARIFIEAVRNFTARQAALDSFGSEARYSEDYE
jgi:uncharacterized protein (UPF0332 family)